jgi:CheY-like chemotaxis protein
VPTRPHALVADDNPSVRALLTIILSGRGYDVTAVGNGVAAEAELLGPAGPGFVAAVLDCDMPGLTGPEVVTRVRAAGSRVPVLFVSGAADPAAIPELTTDPQVAFLPKPFRPDDLVRAVENLTRPPVA